MGAKSRRAVWPFLLILAVLFVLSVSAPSGWRSQKHSADSLQVALNDTPRTPRVIPPAPQILAPIASTDQGDPLVPQPQRASVAPKVTQRHWDDRSNELSMHTPPATVEPAIQPTPSELDIPPADKTSTGQSLVEIPKVEIAAGNQTPSESSSAGFAPVAPAVENPLAITPATDATSNVTADVDAQPTTGATTQQVAVSTSRTPSTELKIKTDSSLQQPEHDPASAHSSDEKPLATPRPISDLPSESASQSSQPVAQQTQPTATPVPSIVPSGLLERLDQLSARAGCQRWTTDCSRAIHDLLDRPITKGERDLYLDAIAALVNQGSTLATSISDPTTAAEVRRLNYALLRRLEIWPATLADPTASVAVSDASRKRIDQSLQRVQSLLLTDATAGATWQQYLLLDALREALHDDRADASPRLIALAQQVLLRMNNSKLDEAQIKFMHSPSLNVLATDLRAATALGVDRRDLLVRIERYESSRMTSDGERLADTVETLNCSDDPQMQQLGAKLESHYRNANARIVIASELLNRMAPEPRDEETDVVDTVAGAEVRGRATTTTRTSFRLVPDRTRLRLGLEANGTVNSRTTASSGPAVFVNQGESRFLVRKLITYNEQGLRVAQAQAEVDGVKNDVESVSTTLDPFPLVGEIARGIAMNKRDDQQGQANRETKCKVASAATHRMDAEVGPRLAKLEADLNNKVLMPLERLKLEPKAIGLETTEQNLLIRYRLAGVDQMGANTARPRALENAWLSYQFHESAINNLIQHLELSGRSFTPPELQAWIAEKMSRPAPQNTEVLENTARFTFADDAAHVRFDGNKVTLTLSIAELQQGRSHWSNFQVRATYEPVMSGLDVHLVRTGVIELISEQFAGKSQFALRGIFGKVLSQERQIPLVPAAIVHDKRLQDLQIAQCVFEDGWMSIGLEPGRVAAKSVMKRR